MPRNRLQAAMQHLRLPKRALGRTKWTGGWALQPLGLANQVLALAKPWPWIVGVGIGLVFWLGGANGPEAGAVFGPVGGPSLFAAEPSGAAAPSLGKLSSPSNAAGGASSANPVASDRAGPAGGAHTVLPSQAASESMTGPDGQGSAAPPHQAPPKTAAGATPGQALAQPTRSALGAADWAVLAGYFLLLLLLTWYSVRKSRDTADDYFLAGRHLGWLIVGASIFSSNIGSEHLVGLAGSGCTDGVAMAHYELHAWCLLVLAWVMVPFYCRAMVFTMPEFLERRYSATARWVLSIISLVAYVLTKIAVGIYAGGVVFRTLLPELRLQLGGYEFDSFWIGSVLVILFTGLYTVLGGLRAVAYTEALQTLVLIVGSVLVTVYGLAELGGWQELRKAPYPGSDLEADYNEGFNLWKPLIPKQIDGKKVEGTWAPVRQEVERDGQTVIRMAWYFNGNYPWLGMLFCAPIIGLWYWCTDQYIVQRALGAPSEREARQGSIFAAYLKLLPVFIFIIPGMICFALATRGYPGLAHLVDANGRAIAERCQSAFPLMVSHVLPMGVRGVVVAGLLAALMSSLAGVFNASSTLFTMDFYQKFRPSASQHQLVWIGRVATTVMVLIGLAWVPVIQGARGLYDYLQTVQGYLAPPIFVVFFFGVFSKRLNAKGCLAALVVGFALGVFRLAVDTPVALKLPGFEQGYPTGSLLWIVNQIYFQYYSLLVFLVSLGVMYGVSYLTEPPAEERIRGLTFRTLTEEDRARSRASWGWGEVVASAVVLAVIVGAYLYFNG